jgi:hypothetical protein
MPTKTVYFTVTPGESEARWIAVNDRDVALDNNKGSTGVDADREKHALTWWFTGDEGAKITIVGSLDKAGTNVVVKVDSEVPEGERDGGGRRRFSLESKGK